MRLFIFLLFYILSIASFAGDGERNKKTKRYKGVDTTYVESYRDLLNVKMIGVVRTNKFSVKDKITQNSLEYSINTNLNLGLGFSYKGIGFEFQYNPPRVNNDDYLYGKSKQLAFAVNSNGRRFIYDVYWRYNQGFHTTASFLIPNDSLLRKAYIYRSDIENKAIGGELTYVFNNKHFSSSAPYNLNKKQKKSAGSFLLGTFYSLYMVNANSVIFPDSLRYKFKEEVQFKNARSSTAGISIGYTYTLVFGKNWFVNLYTLPGFAIQKYYSTNVYDQRSHSNYSVGLSFQARFSIGYNKKNYFIGISLVNTSYILNNDEKSSLTYQNGYIRFYYGHRFDLHKKSKKI